MKRAIFTILMGASAIGFALCQGVFHSGEPWQKYTKPYDIKTPPPVTITEAYALALKYMGPVTNRYHCISTSCVEMTKRNFPGWTFWFANTNGQRIHVDVTFDKELYTDTPEEIKR